MRRLVDLTKLSRLDQLIRRKATGSPNELAQRLEMSRSSLYELIAFLKEEMRAPIIYISDRLSYVYEYTPKFYLGFERDRLNADEMTGTHGGDAVNEKKNKRIKVEIDIDDDEFILDNDIDFNDLYH